MRFVCLIIACLAGIALSSPVPQRATPLIGVVIPSSLAAVAEADFGMGAAVQRPGPSPATTSHAIPTTFTTVSTPVISSSTSTTAIASPSVDVLQLGNRHLGYGNVVSVSSSNIEPVAGMGAALSRKKNGKIS